MASALRQKITDLRAERDKAIEKVEKLEAQLGREERRLQESEAELATYTDRVATIEMDIDEAEERLRTTDEQFKLVDKEAEELEHRARRTKTLSGTDTAKASAMTAKCRVAIKKKEESDENIVTLENQIKVLESDLEICEDREIEFKERLQANEEALLTLAAETRSKEIHTAKSSNYERTLARNVEVLERKLQDAAARAEQGKARLEELEAEIDQLEDDRDEWKKNYEQAAVDLDATMAELNEF